MNDQERAEAMAQVRKSLEAIHRKTKGFVTGNLWTVKRDAEEGLLALSRLEKKP